MLKNKGGRKIHIPIFNFPDLSMVGGTILYALTSIFGYQAWKIEMPLGFTLGSTFEFCLYLGSMGMSVPVAIRNTYKSYRDGTGKMRPFVEAVRPLGTIHILRKHLYSTKLNLNT